MDSQIIPAIPALPINKASSFSKDNFRYRQRCPQPKKASRVHLKENTYMKVKNHTETMKEIPVISFTQELFLVDNEGNVTCQLNVHRVPPTADSHNF